MVLLANPAAPLSAPPETGGGACVVQSNGAFRLDKNLVSCGLFGVGLVVAFPFRVGMAVRVSLRVRVLVAVLEGEPGTANWLTTLAVEVFVGVLVGVAVGMPLDRLGSVSELVAVTRIWRVETTPCGRGGVSTSREACTAAPDKGVQTGSMRNRAHRLTPTRAVSANLDLNLASS
jgi:hypothetical protein